ncbi:hypothetical protein CIHG_00240 [Coccidioides immitis H538.4]|uniref:Uncharacterized protein n=2 Tax=Coccidioides immitis TaxID=5501 RepID=A0A0J8U617_COCIT|nr:hypothetical protein CIRG_07061 [Coccidioides immitis RMSCC 2394]KMU82458.1 hypothetical protein CIHG_00240 [Coccidioides immitis H538.4]
MPSDVETLGIAITRLQYEYVVPQLKRLSMENPRLKLRPHTRPTCSAAEEGCAQLVYCACRNSANRPRETLDPFWGAERTGRDLLGHGLSAELRGPQHSAKRSKERKGEVARKQGATPPHPVARGTGMFSWEIFLKIHLPPNSYHEWCPWEATTELGFFNGPFGKGDHDFRFPVADVSLHPSFIANPWQVCLGGSCGINNQGSVDFRVWRFARVFDTEHTLSIWLLPLPGMRLVPKCALKRYGYSSILPQKKGPARGGDDRTVPLRVAEAALDGGDGNF